MFKVFITALKQSWKAKRVARQFRQSRKTNSNSDLHKQLRQECTK